MHLKRKNYIVWRKQSKLEPLLKN